MRNRYVLIGDLVLVAFCVLAAFALRVDWQFPDYADAFRVYLMAAIVLKPVVLLVFGAYSRYWRYGSIREYLGLALGVTATVVPLGVVMFFALVTHEVRPFPRSIFAIDWLLCLLALAAWRLSIRIVLESRDADRVSTSVAAKRLLVAGAGEAGVLVVREMKRNPSLGMCPVGFLDDAGAKLGKKIHGVPVLGTCEELVKIVSDHRVDEVIVAMPRADGRVVRRIVELCRRAAVGSRTIPGVFELLGGQVSVNRLRSIELGDLLRRAEITSDSAGPAYLAGQRVLVTGAGGSIGREVARQVAYARPAELMLLGHGENSIFDAAAAIAIDFPTVKLRTAIADIRSPERIKRLLGEFQPSAIFHAAAHKHVPLMEQNAEEAITNNVVGTVHLVDAALAAGASRFVMISTDKAVEPSSVMGASKRLAEMAVRNAARQSGRAFMVVRFGNVLGSRGSVVPIFNAQIERGGPVTITHPDMTRYFMTIAEAAHLVLQVGDAGCHGELFVLNMGEPVRIVDLVKDLMRLLGTNPDDISIEYTGLRPGEKLHERLWEESASVQPTDNPDIFRVDEPGVLDPPEFRRVIAALATAARRGNDLEIRAQLAEAITTYVPAARDLASPSIGHD
jgi:FlaA1/EpsC-like NDP-sugar epimerase